MRVFITGITGPVGSALADYLLTLPNLELHAFKRWRSDTRPIEHLYERVTFHEGDIEDAFSIGRAIERAAPDRVYHHVGPQQGDRCSIQTFCRQMALIEAERQEPIIHVGNLETRRDFTHTADVARALWLLLDRATPGEVYNLCSGTATRIGDIVDLVIANGTVPAQANVDPQRLLPSDEPILMGDNRKLRAATGWQPQISIEQIVQELLPFWRSRLARDY